MAENELEIDAPPERVWGVLAQPERYDERVVGAQEVRDADETWPAAGYALHHRTGVGPLTVDDETRVVEADPPRRLVLRAKAKSLGEFEVEIELEEGTARKTTVRIHERAVEGAAAPVPGSDTAIKARNTISLRRLKELAEGTPAASR